ncbi:isoprenoid synthase domain-containing protein [Rhizoctonia solani]|nr:isoprenoid synthase domain-containing protein [Rhizoctonia solani]
MSVSTISLPKLPSYITEAFRISAQTNPHRSKVSPASYVWLDNYGIYADEKRQKFIDSRFDLAAALCFPHADLSHLRIILDIMLWYFSFQGMVDSNAFNSPEKMRSAIDDMMRAVNDPSSPSSNFQPAAMIQYCVQRMMQDAPPLVIQRFVTGLEEHTHAHFQEKYNRSTIPSPEEYIKLRRGTSGMNLRKAMFQYAQGLDLPDQVVDHQSVSELTDTGMDIFNLANDIYSVTRVVQGAHQLNILSVIMYHSDLDLQGSIDFADQLIRKRLEKYIDIKAKLPSFGPGLDEQVVQYIQNIEYAILGFVEWAFITPHYFGNQAESARKTGIVNLEMIALA